ncbi:aspartyl-tRNA synthetase 2, mitochondrial [Bulinus truncatus]|nr:aspartyl-tRNA synthetase 2, mitochondrial [Bulinus truncatus]
MLEQHLALDFSFISLRSTEIYLVTKGAKESLLVCHLCGELRAHHAGESVTLCGWLQFHRLNGAFIVLRDWCGSVQLILPKSKIEEYKSLPLESVLEVKGTVSLRPQGLENKKMATGCVEINVTDLKLLNGCTSSLPFEVQSFNLVKESLRIKHRYLELRLPHLQKVLRLRSDFVMAVRNFLANKNGFVEVETPTLFRRTPGGAREFVVPTHTPGKFYSLPQSPQQFKQLLMVGALDRYFQIARCYRDEGTKPDRQPEFTQIDLEMSFVDQRAVMDVIEQMLLEAWHGECGPISAPFPRMTYQEVMTSYGIDKPDLRFDWKIVQVKAEHFETVPSVFQNFLTNEGMSLQVLRIPQASKHLSNKELEDIKVTSTLKVKDDSGDVSRQASDDVSRQSSDDVSRQSRDDASSQSRDDILRQSKRIKRTNLNTGIIELNFYHKAIAFKKH